MRAHAFAPAQRTRNRHSLSRGPAALGGIAPSGFFWHGPNAQRRGPPAHRPFADPQSAAPTGHPRSGRILEPGLSACPKRIDAQVPEARLAGGSVEVGGGEELLDFLGAFMSNDPNFYAHSENPIGVKHLLRDHLLSVSSLASEFLQGLPWQEDARLAGLLHDLGKYGDLFQRRLQGQE